MTKPKITLRGLATANPPWYVTQAEAYQHYTRLFPMTPAEQELYRRLLLEGPVRGRHVGMDAPEDALETDPDRLVQRYLKFGRSIGADAVRGALAQAGLAPSDIGGLVVNSCTGYLCPGLTSYIAEDVGLPHNLAICDLMGMGCGAALPNLEMATGMLLRNPEKPVLSVAVEICTATLFMGDDPGLVVSNSIFGDGAAAAVLATGPAGRGPQRRMRFLDFQSGLFPEYREHLHYRASRSSAPRRSSASRNACWRGRGSPRRTSATGSCIPAGPWCSSAWRAASTWRRTPCVSRTPSSITTGTCPRRRCCSC